MPTEGQPHPQFHGCIWSGAYQDWACDDGYLLVSGAAWMDESGNVIGTYGGGVGPRTGHVGGTVFDVTGDIGPYRGDTSNVTRDALIDVLLAGFNPFDVFGVNRVVKGSMQTVADEGAATAVKEGLKTIADEGGAAAENAMKALSASGDWVAKVALAFGVGYGVATAVLIAGGAVAGIVVLKVMAAK